MSENINHTVDCLYLLNELHEKNKKLIEENTELKLTIEELLPFKETKPNTDPLLQQSARVIDRLTEENEHLKTQNQRLKEGILWLLEILCKKDPEEDIEFWCQTFFDCNYQTAKEKYGTLSKIMKIE